MLYTETWERKGRERREVWPQTAGEKKRGSAVSSALQRRERVRVVFFTEDPMRAKGAADQVIGRSGCGIMQKDGRGACDRRIGSWNIAQQSLSSGGRGAVLQEEQQ